MANLNKVMLIGRLTRDPEPIPSKSGGNAGAKFGFAVNNRKLNQQTQQWEDVPVFIDTEIWNRGENNKQADRVLQSLRRGQQVYLEGHLRMDTWTDKPENGGGKRSKLVVVVENFQYLEPRSDNGGGGGDGESQPMMRAPRPAATAPVRSNGGSRGGYSNNGGGGFDDDSDMGAPPSRGGGGGGNNEDEIPF